MPLQTWHPIPPLAYNKLPEQSGQINSKYQGYTKNLEARLTVEIKPII